MRAIRKKQYIRYVELLKRKAYVYFYRELGSFLKDKMAEKKTIKKELIEDDRPATREIQPRIRRVSGARRTLRNGWRGR